MLTVAKSGIGSAWIQFGRRGVLWMRDRDLFGEISGRLSGLLQSGGEAAGDLREKVERQLRDGVAELSAINREEFDAQVQALARAEERIAALEKTVAALEEKISRPEPPSAEQ